MTAKKCKVSSPSANYIRIAKRKKEARIMRSHHFPIYHDVFFVISARVHVNVCICMYMCIFKTSPVRLPLKPPYDSICKQTYKPTVFSWIGRPDRLQ